MNDLAVHLVDEVLPKCHRRHRAVEFRSFLKTIDKDVPDELQVHLITFPG